MSVRRRRPLRPTILPSLAIVAIAFGGQASPAVADDDRFSLTVSGFRPSSDTTIRASADDVLGYDVDF